MGDLCVCVTCCQLEFESFSLVLHFCCFGEIHVCVLIETFTFLYGVYLHTCRRVKIYRYVSVTVVLRREDALCRSRCSVGDVNQIAAVLR